MKTIILSAGRGSRLLPLTADLPKCLLPMGESTVLGHQLHMLREAGLTDVHIVVGFKAALVEKEIAKHAAHLNISTVYNPFYQVSDNLASCWMARSAMDDNFLLINGDTLFEADLLSNVIASKTNNIQVTIDHKDSYDWDDMKVTLDGNRLRGIGKNLKPHDTHGESIGMLRFMGEGVFKFRKMLDDIMHTPGGTDAWFLSAIDTLAKSEFPVLTHSIKGLKWAELDNQEDYAICTEMFGGVQNNVRHIYPVA
ncbi:MAG TPA: phosphocholine cytidylyltransferase family protein [Hellea balneolensis]|uniref:Phosphocholine cytidylyltransferase family protein n=1 Tax=Hellea balneolensis TaxID=287478 RepID=A0A7C3C621_9PROT|nr:phosphocholine cytidylyltransferase family protein [Hellea balneolensis]